MNSLDGRNLLGVVLECGKTEGDPDTIIFKDGRRLDRTLTMVRDGKTLGEKWVLAGEKG